MHRRFRSIRAMLPTTTATVVPDGYSLIKEGQASIIFSEKNEVFYNKVQVLNRDLSIAVISYFAKRREAERAARAEKKKAKRAEEAEKNGDAIAKPFVEPRKGIRIFEALSATGLRSIRYIQEVSRLIGARALHHIMVV